MEADFKSVKVSVHQGLKQPALHLGTATPADCWRMLDIWVNDHQSFAAHHNNNQVNNAKNELVHKFGWAYYKYHNSKLTDPPYPNVV